jgi:hypothetical protein
VLFPRTYNEAQKVLGQPDSVLVIKGILDLRGGGLQLRADALKRASLSTMVENAKKEKFFDEEEARLGIIVRQKAEEQEEVIEMVDDEGNVIAGETVKLAGAEEGDGFLGPLGSWLRKGMDVQEAMNALGWNDIIFDQQQQVSAPAAGGNAAEKSRPSSDESSINIQTIELPARAPRQLLLDLKRVFETFPGKERIQLKIGEQIIPVPLTVTRSPVFDMKVEEALGKYAVSQ